MGRDDKECGRAGHAVVRLDGERRELVAKPEGGRNGNMRQGHGREGLWSRRREDGKSTKRTGKQVVKCRHFSHLQRAGDEGKAWPRMGNVRRERDGALHSATRRQAAVARLGGARRR
ncbi:hypothetical protein TRVL_06642 [Trypanosoma vivax]|nr:hypothetical protein TRVL_06642 [Trypanosoma vivax]